MTKKQLADLAFAISMALEHIADNAKADNQPGLLAAARNATNRAEALLSAIREMPLSD
jgi:hypothetical protein